MSDRLNLPSDFASLPPIEQAAQIFQQGGVLAYPTEAVFGVGCDPDNQQAVEKLLQIKQRPIEKGLILLAANYSQLLPYIDDKSIPQDKRYTVLSRWPNGITQIIKANDNTPRFLTGQFDAIAVRITDQPDVVALCNLTNKPIVSTSANLTGEEPARTWQELDPKLLEKLDFVIKGQTLGYQQPSQIINALTGDVIRA
ncbi:threonylcarbamoyl-AMP synthase [Saccharobesus litoralis]|uniref:Threonylcarbamoyl-AMP synthase n=1 Tax=Saccharobesus litoralis TaxID=2172099 RepID=A0A2S0VQH1_9ALTE|nr:L-threonylcarbamoyladenylate synthase [Saccharobesus litoralis]AWB66458.1 threonylcarbamoyl-AMP synthase [Saccharobesus litoralis]